MNKKLNIKSTMEHPELFLKKKKCFYCKKKMEIKHFERLSLESGIKEEFAVCNLCAKVEDI